MYELISNLILYGNLPKDEILVQLAKLLQMMKNQIMNFVKKFMVR